MDDTSAARRAENGLTRVPPPEHDRDAIAKHLTRAPCAFNRAWQTQRHGADQQQMRPDLVERRLEHRDVGFQAVEKQHRSPSLDPRAVPVRLAPHAAPAHGGSGGMAARVEQTDGIGARENALTNTAGLVVRGGNRDDAKGHAAFDSWFGPGRYLVVER